MKAIIQESKLIRDETPFTFEHPFPLVKGNTIYLDRSCIQYIKILAQKEYVTAEELSTELKEFGFNFSPLSVRQLKNTINYYCVGIAAGFLTIQQLTEENKMKEIQAEAIREKETLIIQEKVEDFTLHLKSKGVALHEIIEYVSYIISGKAMHKDMLLKDEVVDYSRILNKYAGIDEAHYIDFKCMQDMRLI